MIVAHDPEVHLTYCTNIHPGESWEEVFANVATHVRAVKARVSPDGPFGVGLRLSAIAAARLAEPSELTSFRDFLRANGLYVFTINGFPHGTFHGQSVKEQVYRPDWLEEERLSYSDALAEILVGLLPDDPNLAGSISTVPGCFEGRGAPADVEPLIARRLLHHAATLWRIRERTGRTIGLALEPEPHCVIETTAQAATFFERHLFCQQAVSSFSSLTGLDGSASEDTLRRHLGVCLDACHAAVEFETPAESVRLLESKAISILKIQVSAGLRVPRPHAAALDELSRFAEGVYLHQTVIRSGNELRRHLDLPEALAESRGGRAGDEWRIHFHVPLFRERLGQFESTQPFLAELLALQTTKTISRHLEIETYTWDVLPEEHRGEPVVEAIAREIRWTMSQLRPPRPAASR